MIFQNNRRISGLENELLKLKSDSKDKEQTINELQNKIESLSIDSDHHYKDLYEISTKENRELNVKIEKLWSELDSLQKLVNQLTIERNKSNFQNVSLEKNYNNLHQLYKNQMKVRDDIENYLRDQLKLLKQENTRLNSLFNSDIHSQVINLDLDTITDLDRESL
ncbi:20633_t:CDS:2 [Gigaspora rosea]|nr:20633_t:CDS:2 [Gigaspora rosea]